MSSNVPDSFLDPIDAMPYDFRDGTDFPARRRTQPGCVVIALVLTGLSAIVIGGIVIAYFKVTGTGGLDIHDGEARRLFQPAERVKIVAEAFREPRIDVDPDTQRDIERLIDKVLKSARDEDFDTVMSKIDPRGFTVQMDRSGGLEEPMSGFERLIFINRLPEITTGPTGYDGFQIASIHRLNDDECVVYLHLWSEYEDANEERWWFVHRKGGWLLTDWEMLDFGVSEAEHVAITSEHQDQRDMDRYHRSMDMLEEAYSSDSLDQEEIRRKLIAGDELEVHAKLNGYKQLCYARHLRAFDELDRARDCLNRIDNLDLVPGAYYTLCNIAESANDYEQALQFAEKYIQALGAPIAGLRQKARLLQSLQSNSESARVWLEVYRTLPDQKDALSSAASALTEEDLNLLTDAIGASSSPAELALYLGESLHSRQQLFVLEGLRPYLEQNGAYPGADLFLQGVRNQLRFEYDDAVRAFRNAAAAALDPEHREVYDQRWLNLICEMGTLVDGYRDARDPDQFFNDIVLEYEYGDYDFPAEQLTLLLEQRRETHPDDATLLTCLIQQKMSAGAAAEEIEELIRQALPKVSDDEDTAEEFAHHLAVFYSQQGQELQFYKETSDKESVFSSLARSLLEYGKFAELEQLIALHQEANPGDPITAWYAAEMLLQSGDAEAAAARLADAPDDENTPRWQFDDLPARCALEADQVDKYMEESDDPDDSLKQLVSVLIDQGKFTRAREVIASCGPRCREPATMPELTLRIAMADNDDAALIAACEGMGDTIWKTDVYGNWSIANAKYACLAACLRQGRREEAGTIAERLRSESKRSGAIAAVMMNDFATAETILSDEDMNQQSLTYYSENVNVLWRQASSTEAGKSLRGKFPPTWNSRSDEIVLLFFDNTAAWLNQLEASALQQSLSEAFGPGVEVFDTPTDNDAPQRNGKWRRSFFNDDFQGVVECVPWTDIRVDDTSLVDILRRRPSITRVLVCTVYDDRQEINLLPPMTRWAQLMSRQGCVAAYVEELSRALLDPVDQLAEIDAGHPYSWYGVGATSYLFPAGMSKHHATNSEWWRVAAESAKRFDELVDGNVSNVQIRCTWDMGISSMDAWMRVVEVRRDSDMCVGEIVDSQAPLPLLSSGTRYLVPLRQIKQWREEP